MDAQTVDWGMWWAKTFVMALLALGIVKVMDIVDWWATRKTRRVVVQVEATPEELDAIAEDSGPRYEMHNAIQESRVWVDCPALNRVNLAYHQQRFPDARYRLVRLGEED